MILPEVPPLVDFRKTPWAAVPLALPACRSTLIAAALASDVGSGPGLTCETFSVPCAVSWPLTSAALNAVLAETTLSAALLAPPSAARLRTATWSPGVVDMDFALTATPADTVTETALVGGFTRSGVRSPIPAAAPLALGATTPSDRPLSMPSRLRLETSVDWGTAAYPTEIESEGRSGASTSMPPLAPRVAEAAAGAAEVANVAAPSSTLATVVTAFRTFMKTPVR